jgi:hypothetical protein
MSSKKQYFNLMSDISTACCLRHTFARLINPFLRRFFWLFSIATQLHPYIISKNLSKTLLTNFLGGGDDDPFIFYALSSEKTNMATLNTPPQYVKKLARSHKCVCERRNQNLIAN